MHGLSQRFTCSPWTTRDGSRNWLVAKDPKCDDLEEELPRFSKSTDACGMPPWRKGLQVRSTDPWVVQPRCNDSAVEPSGLGTGGIWFYRRPCDNLAK